MESKALKLTEVEKRMGLIRGWVEGEKGTSVSRSNLRTGAPLLSMREAPNGLTQVGPSIIEGPVKCLALHYGQFSLSRTSGHSSLLEMKEYQSPHPPPACRALWGRPGTMGEVQ